MQSIILVIQSVQWGSGSVEPWSKYIKSRVACYSRIFIYFHVMGNTGITLQEADIAYILH